MGFRRSRNSTCGDVGRRGRRYMRSGALLAKSIPRFVVWCRVTVGLLRPSGGVEISRGLASGSSLREIAKCLERAVSTVRREVARHGGRPAYRASQAEGEAWQSALRPKRCLLSINLKLRNTVASKLILDWSPKQISGWLKTQYPVDESMRVSHETIYRSLFIQARGALKKELLDHLRSKRRIRRSQHSRIPEAISIRKEEVWRTRARAIRRT